VGDEVNRAGAPFVKKWAITVVVILLMYAALDDITTDNATSFPLEYTMLVAGAAWLLYVAVGLIRSRRRIDHRSSSLST
jgi:threonine/homoserine/homoserine lactone efflux protein